MVDPTLADLRNLCISLDDEAQVLLAAIAAKESGIEHRDHVDAPGRDVLAPALGVWQSERGGVVSRGCSGILPAGWPQWQSVVRKALRQSLMLSGTH
ncbi:MAG: hypothetical protein JWO24_995 [Rhodospirillales bacterium]|jgi:hypothetical protein|nr:hypothetical protein [Rhodospirillales bacterium]